MHILSTHMHDMSQKELEIREQVRSKLSLALNFVHLYIWLVVQA